MMYLEIQEGKNAMRRADFVGQRVGSTNLDLGGQAACAVRVALGVFPKI